VNRPTVYRNKQPAKAIARLISSAENFPEVAKPFLEKWLKKRYSPKSMIKQMKRHIPDWLEYLPQIPPLIFDVLQSKQSSNNSVLSTEPVAAKSKKLTGRIGAAAVGVGVGLAFPHWAEPMAQLPGSSLILATLGLLILLLR
jgi:ubiquinone biosynthesis protein